MFTYMTRSTLWRAALDLHPYDLRESIETAKLVLSWLMGETVVYPPELHADWTDVSTAWTSYEHALANYGAVLCAWEWKGNLYKLSPEATWFAEQQRIIRAENWPYTRPAWATDEAVHTMHRQKLVNLRPDFYGPKFGMEKTE